METVNEKLWREKMERDNKETEVKWYHNVMGLMVMVGVLFGESFGIWLAEIIF